MLTPVCVLPNSFGFDADDLAAAFADEPEVRGVRVERRREEPFDLPFPRFVEVRELFLFEEVGISSFQFALVFHRRFLLVNKLQVCHSLWHT